MEMNIACLGWGSLVWDPKSLPVKRGWFEDGPLLPIEFARQSGGQRITLVIVPKVPFVRTQWALMSVNDLQVAKTKLAEREGILHKNIGKHIGFWKKGLKTSNEISLIISKWAITKNLDAVVWTALPPKLNKTEGKLPKIDDVLTFIRELSFEEQRYAEEYIRKAPIQIDTKYRRRMENEFNWKPLAGK